ncbi:transcription antiterminator [Pelosinus sp. UFO1]|uniref:BglG family transcription antiterminator n=1 Tax=Pelosinus sp. UFO1 TaxID=484770 RepID=UPI0004D0F698|nr:fructose PTS transporter subunit IIA [Pelosinus sp. UFO1]AIF50952.1 PTS modulated transcriptional regulator, MtlR family [Pelosinus sp. UFO1]
MERILAIIRILLNRNQAITVDEIAGMLTVSNKTIRNDLSKVEDHIKNTGLLLVKKTGSGILLQGSEEQKVSLSSKIENSRGADQPFSPKARKYSILKRLLMADNQIRMQDLADELYVSKVTIHKDLVDVEEWLNGFELNLLSKTNYGIEVIGEEENWRKAVVSLIAYHREQDELKEMLYEHYGGRIDYKTLRKLKELINIDFRQLERILTQAEEKLAFHFSDEAYVSLVIHVAIAIKRLEHKKDICLANRTLLHLQSKDEYQVAKDIGESIEASFQVTLPEPEIGYILLHILGAKMQQNPIEEVHLKLDEDNNLALVIAREIITIAQGVLNVDFTNDKQLLTGLLLHLRPTINRLKYGLTLKNPILHEIKENYPEVYGAAWMTSIVFEKYVGCRVNEEEIGYIALHIGAAMERSKKTFKALVVCTSGIGTSQLLAARLGRCFRDIEIKNILSVADIQEDITHDVDFIISTVPLSRGTVNRPVIHISPLLVQKDIRKLETFINEFNTREINYNGGILMLINEDLINLDIEATDKADVIRQMALLAEKAGKISSLDEFIQDVLERENNFSTGVGNGIAIPHGKSKAVKEAMFVFGKIRQGIDWGSHDGSLVNLIFLLGVPAENLNNVHLKILSQLSMKLMDEDFIEILNNADTKQGILEALSIIQVE